MNRELSPRHAVLQTFGEVLRRRGWLLVPLLAVAWPSALYGMIGGLSPVLEWAAMALLWPIVAGFHLVARLPLAGDGGTFGYVLVLVVPSLLLAAYYLLFGTAYRHVSSARRLFVLLVYVAMGACAAAFVSFPRFGGCCG